MSVLIESLNTVASSGGGGITDLINDKLTDVNATLKLGGSVGVVMLLMFMTFKGGFTIGKLLVNAFIAGLFLFIINNPNFLADKTENELNSSPSLTVPAHPTGVSDGLA